MSHLGIRWMSHLGISAIWASHPRFHQLNLGRRVCLRPIFGGIFSRHVYLPFNGRRAASQRS